MIELIQIVPDTKLNDVYYAMRTLQNQTCFNDENKSVERLKHYGITTVADVLAKSPPKKMSITHRLHKKVVMETIQYACDQLSVPVPDEWVHFLTPRSKTLEKI